MKKIRKRPIAFIWILSFIILLSVSVAANVVVAINLSRGFNSLQKKQNAYILKNVCANIDLSFRDVNKLSEELRSAGSTAEMLSYTQMQPEAWLGAAEIRKKISEVILNYQMLEGGFIYLPKVDLIISQNSILTSYEYYLTNYSEKPDGYSAWRLMLTDSGKRVINHYEYEDNVIYEFLDYFSTGKGFYTVGVTISRDYLFKDIINMEDESCAIAVLQRNNTILLASDTQIEKSVLKNVDLGNEYEVYMLPSPWEDRSIMYTKSNIYDYRYAFISPTSFLTRDTNYMMSVSVGMNVLCIFIMLIVMSYAYRWNYKKIKDILIKIYPLGTVAENEAVDEYQTIESKIDYLDHQNITMERQLRKQKKVLENNFLSDFMKGYIKDENLLKLKMEEYSIKWEYKYFAVSALCMKNYGIMDDGGRMDASFIVENIINDMPTHNHMLSVDMDGLVFYVINMENDDYNEFKKDVTNVFESASAFAAEAVEIEFITATSDICSGVESIPILYEQALRALEYSEFYGAGPNIFLNDIEKVEIATLLYDYSALTENKLLFNMKSNNINEVKSIISSALVGQPANGERSGWVSLAYNILNTLLKSMIETDKKNQEEIAKKIRAVEKCETIDELKNVINGIADGIYAINISGNKKTAETYERVKAYIDMEYTDTGLNVEILGKRLNMSSLYLSRLFKEHSGVKLSKYISQKRVEYAKELLSVRDELKIDDIAEMAGFDCRRTFSNVFKEFVGISPSQFRSIVRG